MKKVLCAGIVVADHVCNPIDHLPAAGELVMTDNMLLTIGGCAANAAVNLAKMEVDAAVAGRVGGDVFGRIVADLLKESGVDVTGLKVSEECETSQTMIVNVAGEDRRFIHTFGANAEFQGGDLPIASIDQYAVFYVGGCLLLPKLDPEKLAAAFAAAKKANVKTVLDIGIPEPGHYLGQLCEVLPHVDVFLPNDDEALELSGEPDPLRQAEFFRERGAKTVVITMGEKGSLLLNNEKGLRAGVYDIPFVDGSGGGDAFDAGFIYGLLNAMAPEDCLRFASALGASCVRAIGTTPGVFNKSECVEFLRRNSLQIDEV